MNKLEGFSRVWKKIRLEKEMRRLRSGQVYPALLEAAGIWWYDVWVASHPLLAYLSHT